MSKTSVLRSAAGPGVTTSTGSIAEGDYTHRGNFSVIGNIACRSFSMLSDGTSKSNVEEVPAHVCLSSLNVPLKSWRWDSGPDTSPHVGFISQDVRGIGDLSVYEIVQRREVEGGSKLFLKTEEFNFLRTEALKIKVTALEEGLQDARNRIAELENTLEKRAKLLADVDQLLKDLKRPNCLKRFCQWLWN